MKKTLLFSTSIFFVLGTSFAHEVAVSQVITTHKEIVEHRIAQIDTKTGTLCNTSYITTTTNGIKSATRKSVDCGE